MSEPQPAPGPAAATEVAVRGIGKCYRIYRNPQDRFKQALLDRWHRARGRSGGPLYREHWALRDVSFEMAPGEAVGILGRNGAGKSTLLQIIAGTLEPTEGSVEVNGRVTALLELGSGFNPEFTGRENVVLNGQILGLTEAEIARRMDDILAFADIGDFVDQPVKTYSSGMMMRLAFSVQTAVDPKLLIVDEALAVGDMYFQAKCMSRIAKLVDDGVSLLFVSHDISSIRQVCSKALLLEGGRCVSIGDAATITDSYVRLQLESLNRASIQAISAGTTAPVAENDKARIPGEIENGREAFERRAAANRVGSGLARILNVQIFRGQSQADSFEFDEEILVRVAARFDRRIANVNMGLKIRTLQGVDVAFFDTRIQGELARVYEPESTYSFDWRFRLPLVHGSYCVAAGLAQPPSEGAQDWMILDFIPIAGQFRVAPRRGGMLDGFVALPATLDIKVL